MSRKITARMRCRLKREFSSESPTIWIGKGQVSVGLIKEIEKQLDKRKIVKVKILKTALKEVKAAEIAVEISKQTKAEIVDVRGHTFILYKHKI
ncbi:MAG: YhbY family RNA-binding protein [Candidatus Bathyarchaeota archaeon]|nr:YhbY family RNA-binding protein [Candidatus Bathyarchaeota archaeon]MDW8040010.1 YhbY family RNA-binding protein [Nitrososphaerota archaeon]